MSGISRFHCICGGKQHFVKWFVNRFVTTVYSILARGWGSGWPLQTLLLTSTPGETTWLLSHWLTCSRMWWCVCGVHGWLTCSRMWWCVCGVHGWLTCSRMWWCVCGVHGGVRRSLYVLDCVLLVIQTYTEGSSPDAQLEAAVRFCQHRQKNS